jgi:hypothetical protein
MKLPAEAATAVDKHLQERGRKEWSEGIQAGDVNHHRIQIQNVRRESER